MLVMSRRCWENNHSECMNDGKNMASRDKGKTVEDCECNCHEDARLTEYGGTFDDCSDTKMK